MWDLPGPGTEPMSPALAGRFLTTVPPGKSLEHYLDGWVGFVLMERVGRVFQVSGSTDAWIGTHCL